MKLLKNRLYMCVNLWMSPNYVGLRINDKIVTPCFDSLAIRHSSCNSSACFSVDSISLFVVSCYFLYSDDVAVQSNNKNHFYQKKKVFFIISSSISLVTYFRTRIIQLHHKRDHFMITKTQPIMGVAESIKNKKMLLRFYRWTTEWRFGGCF